MSFPGSLHQRRLSRASHAAENPHAQRNTFAQRLAGSPCLGLDLDILGHIIENADTNMVEAKGLLYLAHNFRQHLLRVFTGNRCLGNIVEESELPGATLLLRE